MLGDFFKRMVGSLVATAVAAVLLIFAYVSFFPYLVIALMAMLTGLAIWEYGELAKIKGGEIPSFLLILIGVLLVISFFCSALWSLSWNLPLLVWFIGFFGLAVLHFKETSGAIVDLAVSSFGLIYIAIPLGMMTYILYSNEGGDGRWWIAYLVVVTKISDIGAYFWGSIWGQHKLAPKISPGKTVEGAVVGLFCSIAASFVFYAISLSMGNMKFSFPFSHALFLGLILGGMGQFGDLAESLLKRDANRKDSNALPGLGGALDLIDSLLFNAVILYLYLQRAI